MSMIFVPNDANFTLIIGVDVSLYKTFMFNF